MDLKQLELIGSIPSPIQQLKSDFLIAHDICIWVKRDDLIHPIISGNKWRKLKFHLRKFINSRSQRLVSIGGAFSNHLHALAYAGYLLNVPTLGLIQGYNIDWNNPTLSDCRKWGMTFEEIDKKRFGILHNNPSYYMGTPEDYFVPLGGTDQLGIKGILELADELNQFDTRIDLIAVPFGSGGTITGLVKNCKIKNCRIVGFSSFNGKWESELVKSLLQDKKANVVSWAITNAYRMKGFAKHTEDLMKFIDRFQTTFDIELDHIYNGKMMYGIWDMIHNGHIKRGSRIIAIHTGGTQGRRGLK